MSESGDSSRHSFSTGGASSVVSDNSDAQALTALQDRAGGAEDDNNNDLVSGNRGVSEAIFATLVLLAKNRGQQDLRWVALRVVLEFLMMFRVVFNTEFLWVVNRASPAFKAIKWVLFRFLVLPKGYNTYIVVFYVIAGTIFLSLALTAYVAVVLKKDDSAGGGWIARLVAVMQLLAMIMYSVAWTSILDYIVFMFACEWQNVSVMSRVTHVYFTDRSCMAMPHLAHMAFAIVVVVVFCLTALCLSVGDCDLNPLTRNVLATPAAMNNLTNLALKMVMVILSTAGVSNHNFQSVVMAVCSGYITYQMIMAAAYYSAWVNHVWNGLWTGIVYTCILLNVVTYRYKDDQVMAKKLTDAVLYGIFPAVLLGALASAARIWWLRRPLPVFAAAKDDPEAQRNLAKVFRFKSVAQVEALSRVMRKWDEDGVPDEEATALGEFIYKCGLARFPNEPTLMIAIANLHIEAHKDGQQARTQLQLAIKSSPGIIQRFFIYKTQDLAKKLKDESGGLDLMGYIEFQRNYRACVRSHRVALQAQKIFWQVLLHDTVPFKSLQNAFAIMNQAEKQAAQIYRRVLERYPSNGRLLKIYGRFLEWVKNEPSMAQKYYVEAMKQGMGESLLGLIGGTTGGEQDTTLKALGSVDEKTDGIIIINAVGIIMAVNRAAFKMFQYQKGELESKNVSCLMPQPFSGRHNGYLQHYITTGEVRILNTNQAVVGVTKHHVIFPVSLTVVKLSGSGQDCIFMGLMRRAEEPDPSVVRLWVAPASGVILCADERFADNFGISHADVAGRAFSTLGPDMEALDGLIEKASTMPIPERRKGCVTLDTKLLHRFLPPVDVHVTVGYAGTVSEMIIVLEIQAYSLAGAMMAVDHKGRIVYATSQLGVMLGYSARQVAAMELSAIIPPPYSQMHPGFMKELGNKPPATSCRAGAVVHLLRSNGVKVPVTLQLSTHDDGERIQHVVRVAPSSDTVQSDRQRLVVGLAPDGTIASVNAGATKALFGFNPQDIIGKPVRSVINVFGDWAKKFGEDTSLLTALGVRALEGVDESWRVCVVSQGHEDGDKAAGGSALLAALQQRNRVRPALLQAEVVLRSDADAPAASASGGVAASTAGGKEAPRKQQGQGDEEATLQLVLWRADALAAIVELDKSLAVVRADAAAGLLFGVSSKQLIKKDFRRLAGLPKGATAHDLMTSSSGGPGHGKKSGLKAGAAAKVGVRKTLNAVHADGQPLVLQAQAVSKQAHGEQHLVVRLQLADPSPGGVEPLLPLKAGAAAARELFAAGGAESGSDSGGDDGGGGSGGGGSGGGAKAGKFGGNGAASKGARRGAALEERDEEDAGSDGGSGGGSPRGRGRSDPKGRVAAWVKEADAKHPVREKGRRKAEAEEEDEREEDEEEEEEGDRGRGRGSLRGGGGGGDAEGSVSEASSGGRGAPGGGAPHAHGGAGSFCAGAGGASMGGDGTASQQSGSEAGDGASSVVGDGGRGDEELSADFRRAKRLKKLNRMLTSSAAQSATHRFKRQTWLVVGVILAAHVVGYAILATQIKARFENMHDSANMARATDRFQLTGMRINFAQKCSLPDYANYEVCTPASIAFTLGKLLQNLVLIKDWHHTLYLGGKGANGFSDPRLYNFWTRAPLAEQVYLESSDDANGGSAILHRNATIWEMGNKFISAGYDTHYNAPLLGSHLNTTSPFQYIFLNGPHSIFYGYSWSLDVQVDYSWISLGALSTILVVLLIVEALIVQTGCMVYQFLLVRQVNLQHMRRFSVFLALPSATIRIMASRQMVVDDDGSEEGDDNDDVDALAATGAHTGAATTSGDGAAGDVSGAGGKGEGDKEGKKRVSMAAGAEEDEEGDGKAKAKGKSASGKKRSSTVGAAADKKKPPKTLARRVYNALFWWLDTVIKVNGKKLFPNNVVVLKFMVPLLMWAAAVVIVFGVTFQKLAGLQAPLASLNAAARVTYLISRVRLMGNYLAFSSDTSEYMGFKAQLLQEIALLRSSYTALMYGGDIVPIANVSYTTRTPAAAFASQDFAQLFFRTTNCLRDDQSGCFPEGNQWYTITHSGLDAMVERYMDTYEAFANLPENLASANHPLYLFLNDVGGHDMVEGIYKAVNLFEDFTISQFEGVTRLHQIMLVITIFLVVGFMLLLFRPYVKLLHEESKDIAGMLSQLPAEVNVEETVKTHVLGLPPRGDGCSASMMGGASMMGPSMMGGMGMVMLGPNGQPLFPGGMSGMGGPPGMTGPGGRMMIQAPPGYHPGGGGCGGMFGGADGAVAVNIGGGRSGAGGGGWGAPGYY